MSGLEIRCESEQVFIYLVTDAIAVGSNGIGDSTFRILLEKFCSHLDVPQSLVLTFFEEREVRGVAGIKSKGAEQNLAVVVKHPHGIL